VLSAFDTPQRRVTSDLARRRNALVAALSAGLLIAHAPPGSKTEELARQALAAGKAVWAVECAANRPLFARGVQPVTPATAADTWLAYRAASTP
jgi:predicted Rossmann fold nucleotide-binding protein DprA/Smf involved in DNA uptake